MFKMIHIVRQKDQNMTRIKYSNDPNESKDTVYDRANYLNI